MRINILESGGLAKPEELIMYKAVLNSVQFLDVINNRPTCFSYKVLYKNISTNRNTDTKEKTPGHGELQVLLLIDKARVQDKTYT